MKSYKKFWSIVGLGVALLPGCSGQQDSRHSGTAGSQESSDGDAADGGVKPADVSKKGTQLHLKLPAVSGIDSAAVTAKASARLSLDSANAVAGDEKPGEAPPSSVEASGPQILGGCDDKEIVVGEAYWIFQVSVVAQGLQGEPVNPVPQVKDRPLPMPAEDYPDMMPMPPEKEPALSLRAAEPGTNMPYPMPYPSEYVIASSAMKLPLSCKSATVTIVGLSGVASSSFKVKASLNVVHLGCYALEANSKDLLAPRQCVLPEGNSYYGETEWFQPSKESIPLVMTRGSATDGQIIDVIIDGGSSDCPEIYQPICVEVISGPYCAVPALAREDGTSPYDVPIECGSTTIQTFGNLCELAQARNSSSNEKYSLISDGSCGGIVFPSVEEGSSGSSGEGIDGKPPVGL